MFTLHKFPNGIRIILAPTAQTAAVTFLIIVKVGSRHEPSALNGISHFLEHQMFKGTKRRPSTLLLSQELDAIGADYNAYTAKDHTGYYIKAEVSHLELAVDMLSDMLSESLLASEEVERERGTILEEINMYEDNPMAKIGDMFEADLFGANTSLGRRVIGTPARIKSLTRAQLVDYWRERYGGANLTLCLAGRFNKARALVLLKQKFGGLKRGRAVGSRSEPIKTRRARFAAHFKETNQAHLVLGFPGLSYTHPARHAAALLAIILGGNMSSRLFIKVRERLGLCYFIHAGLNSYEDTGIFAIQAGLDLTKLDKALLVISQELADIKKHGVKAEELAKAKQYSAGKIVLGLEDSFDTAAFYAKQAVFEGRVLTPPELLAKIKAVRLAEVRRLARRLLDVKKAQLTTISPLKDINKFARFVKF